MSSRSVIFVVKSMENSVFKEVEDALQNDFHLALERFLKYCLAS